MKSFPRCFLGIILNLHGSNKLAICNYFVSSSFFSFFFLLPLCPQQESALKKLIESIASPKWIWVSYLLVILEWHKKYWRQKKENMCGKPLVVSCIMFPTICCHSSTCDFQCLPLNGRYFPATLPGVDRWLGQWNMRRCDIRHILMEALNAPT